MDENRICGATSSEMEYEHYYQLFLEGIITKEEWINFCINYIEIVMKENKKLLDKLKNA